MLNIKKLLTKILKWIDSPTITHSTTGSTGSLYTATSNWTNASEGTSGTTTVSFGVGGGGTNHGVYSEALNNWIIHADKNGEIHLGGAASANQFNNLFVSTEHTLTSNLTITNGNTSNSTYTVTKAGYTPVGVVGWRTINGSGSGGSYALCFGATLSSASSGSGTVNLGIRAVGAVTKCTLLATVLWIKNI